MSEPTAGLPAEWMNERGDPRYQPAAYDHLLWATALSTVWRPPRVHGGLDPKLYRSKARAIRIGRRRERHLDRKVFIPADA